MKLATRMWLLGAVLPAAGTAVAVLAGGLLFRASLAHDVDRALAAQASSERVSLFDSPDGRPHIHMDPRGLDPGDRLASAMTLYGPDGEPIAHYPLPAPSETPRVMPGDPDAPPQFETRRTRHGDERVLRLTVQRAPGAKYVLEIAAPLAPVERAVDEFYRVTLGIALALAALLFLVHGVHARRLATRVRRLARHMAALREGNLEHDAPADLHRDEIGALGAIVAEATQRLREARAAQERLLADAAHELRTPLTLMRTTVDVALRRPRAPGELHEVLRDVRDEVDRIAQLATRLLDASAAGQGAWDRSPGDLAELARDAVEGARGAAEERELLVDLEAPGPVPVSVHAGSVRQAVDNLLSNALRHAPRGSTIRVTAAPLPNGGGRIAVHDDGPGIPEAERERVFEPFRRAAASGGVGLGLAIVRRIAEKHGGRAYAAASPSGGATVVIELSGTGMDRARAAASHG